MDFLRYVARNSADATAVEADLSAAVQLAAVAEYMCAELLELSGNVARDRSSRTIDINDIVKAIDDDKELVSEGRAFRHHEDR